MDAELPPKSPLTVFLFCSSIRHGDGAPFRSAVLGRSLGRQRSAIEALVALTGDYGVARAAYDEAIKRRPGRTITLGRRRGYWQTAGENDDEDLYK